MSLSLSLPLSIPLSPLLSALAEVLAAQCCECMESVESCGEPDASQTSGARKDAVAMVTQELLGSFGN